MVARLVRRGWLLRGIEVLMSDGVHVVEYNGRPVGYEQVSVDRAIIRKLSLWWFVPEFQFWVGGHLGVVVIRVWPWFSLRSVHLWIGDELVYAEGDTEAAKKKKTSPGDWDELA